MKIHMNDWIMPYKKSFLKVGFEGWFTIAWVFGYREELTKVAEHLVRILHKGEGDDYVNSEGRVVDSIATDLFGILLKGFLFDHLWHKFY